MNRLVLLLAIGIVVGIIVGIAVAPFTNIMPSTTVTQTVVSTTTFTQIATETILMTATTTTTIPTTLTTKLTVTQPTTIVETVTTTELIPQTITITSMPTPTTTIITRGTEQKLFEFVLPWNDNAASSFDLSQYLDKPAGKYGFVYVGSDGHLYVGDKRIKFLGVSVVGSWIFAPPSIVDQYVERLAKYGVNLVRIHAMDQNWDPSRNIFKIPSTRELDPQKLDRLDYLIYKLKENGIYVDINLMCYRSYSSYDGLPKEVDQIQQVKDKHILPFFYEPAKQLVKEFAYKLFTHVNGYTGVAYKDEPAIAFIEVLNEYGIIFGWLDGAIDRLPMLFKNELQKKWNEYLLEKYGSTQNLLKSWGSLKPGEYLENGAIKIFTLDEYRTRPETAQRDWVEFLWRLEYDFYMEMYRYLKEEIGVKQLVIGTQVVFGGTPNIQQNLDVVDTHHYWRYPVGSGNDFYVVNDAMVNNPLGSTIIRLAYTKIFGKPYTVSEYNHPAPNMYRSEGFILLPAYAAFQDWDAIMPYSYGGPSGPAVFDSKMIRGTLEFDQDPARWPLMITAYMLFIRGDVSPARYWVPVELSRETEIELIRSLRASVWNLPNGLHIAPPHIPLLHGVGLVTTNGTRPSTNIISIKDVSMPDKPVYVSDTGELIWDCSYGVDKCVFIVNTSRSIVLTGFISGRRFDFGDVVIEVGETMLNGYATIALHVLDGQSFKDTKKILVIAIGAVFNTGMNIYEYDSRKLLFTATTNMTSIPDTYGLKITTFGNWGRPPTIVEGINATIMIKTQYNAFAYVLDSRGLPRERIDMISSEGYRALYINNTYSTIWYEINIFR
ncbi:hypothetical protein Igag_0510 [Ignisphaera aggregans DSM 17230]|uniref:Uncharacterized protein n=1 Tax=Ignisphaera aggregans (strain DSM 17230 / JCM 13409 / AQ1.S1) TaxID=583356 RepID=E0SRZ8_IGNAA|nr:hypothetical protein Igag_0510 [Ignisphaera aggregans DSM 17230]